MKRLVLIALSLLCSAPALAATCKISEYRTLVIDSGGRIVPVPQEPSITTQSVTYTTATASAAFNTETRFVRIVCDAKAHFRFSTASTNPTATSPYLAPDVAEYFGVPQGQSYLVKFYDGTS